VFGSRGGFTHTGGTHVVNGLLEVHPVNSPYTYDRPASYTFSEGQLTARDIRLNPGAIFAHTGGTISQSGTLTLVGAVLSSAPRHHQFGRLELKASSGKSILLLTNEATTIRFLASDGIAWDLAADLVIRNWRGATNGGGQHQVIFGNNSAGLTSQQLSQIYFLQPSGLPPSEYSATILATGELVPLLPTGRFPALTFQRSFGQVRLEWPSGYALQRATNIFGPFIDVNIPSPYFAYPGGDPDQFFRLRRQ
jgi:hypothetical protein